MKPPVQLALTDRDASILEMVFSFGGVSAGHIHRRWFPTPGSRAAAYARISKLVAAEYLGSTRLPASSGQGSGKAFLTLGPKGRPVLAKLLNCSVSALQRQSRAKAPAILQHHLATCDFRLSLELAVEASTLLMSAEWTPEWELRRKPLKITDPVTENEIPLIADGAFTLSLADGSEQDFLVEIDMGTMTSPKRVRAKFRGYLLRDKDDQVPVLWVTSSAARAATLAKWAAEEAKRLSADPTIFWITTQGSADEKTVLVHPIWQVVGGPAAMAIASLASDEPIPVTPSSSLQLVGG